MIDNELLTFKGPGLPTAHSPIIRDDDDVLVFAKRSQNASSEWQIRGYKVSGRNIKFSVASVEQAHLAAVFVEVFDTGDLTTEDRYAPTTPLREGVPVVVATDGKPAIAAWLRVRAYAREEIAQLLNVSDRTVTEYFSRFRSRGVGISDDVDAPGVGSLMPELPASMDYSGGEDA